MHEKSGKGKAGDAGGRYTPPPLEVGQNYMVRRMDNTWHEAEVIHRRFNTVENQTDYYVHYANFNRRLDEWVLRERIMTTNYDGLGMNEDGAGGANHNHEAITAAAAASSAENSRGQENYEEPEEEARRDQPRPEDLRRDGPHHGRA